MRNCGVLGQTSMSMTNCIAIRFSAATLEVPACNDAAGLRARPAGWLIQGALDLPQVLIESALFSR
jgi:hypothetical protein